MTPLLSNFKNRIMKIEILKEGKKDAETGKPLKVGQKIEVSKKRGEKALKNGNAKLVEETKEESTQEKISKKTKKK